MKLTQKESDYIEGYAAALQDLLLALTGDNFCAKSYDPMTIENNIMFSYAFDMKDGGRKHDAKDYLDVDEIKMCLLNEVKREIEFEIELK